MKQLLTIGLTLLLVSFATTALAERGYGRGEHGYHVSKGERINRHLDRKGDRIRHRFEHKAIRAENRGHYRQADRFRAKGDRIDRRLDRRGDRIHARHDRHARYDRHYRDHRHGHQHRHHYTKPRTVYRSYSPYDTYFGVMINQPGLWLGWGFYD